MNIMKGIKGIIFVEMNKKDIIRHKLVTRIVEAYEKYEEAFKEEKGVKKEEKNSKDNKKHTNIK